MRLIKTFKKIINKEIKQSKNSYLNYKKIVKKKTMQIKQLENLSY